MKTYFITGATGAIGACLVPMLLSHEDVRVRLLIRARDQEHLKGRLGKLLSFWEYPSAKATHQRIKAYRGDVSLPGLGMTPQEYEALAKECTHIIHSAGNVRMNLSLDEARKSSVSSANNITAFASACQRRANLQKMEFVSTVGVGGRMSGVVPETWIGEKRSFHNTYEEAKAEAEELIHHQIEKGLPVTVHRPSMVVGHSETGEIIHFQIFYHICEFLTGRRTLGLLPELKGAYLDIIPVDYVAGMVIWSSNQTATIGKILHSCSGPDNAVSIEKLKHNVKDIFRLYGEKVPLSATIPLSFFKAGLPLISPFIPSSTRRVMKTLPLFFDYLAQQQSFSNVNTKTMMEKENIQIPSADVYLEKVLGYYIVEKRKQRQAG